MSILLISDIHLCVKRPEITNSFLDFLNHRVIYASALYILGDLFETWLGDDDHNLLHISIAKALHTLKQKNIPCYFIHGNHDFLLGKKYADLCGMILLPKTKILQLPSGKRIILLHGDTLCVNDISYQIFKRCIYYFKIKKMYLLLPLFIRLYIFNIIRFCCLKSKKYKKKIWTLIYIQLLIF